jgi:tetratricopeptide (TPR) repeat protein
MGTIELEEGIKLRKEKKLAQATRFFSSYVDKYPNDPLGWYYLGVTFDNRSKERDAIPCYKNAISLGIEHSLLVNAYLFLGSSLRKTGNPTQALLAFERAENMGCHDAFLFYSKAKAYLLVGNLAKAQKSAEDAVKVNPRAPVYRKLLSIIKSRFNEI